MKIKRLICFILSLILTVACFTGCDSNEAYVLYFELDSPPKTLDPQLASGTSEELLIKNLFEGLVRENDKGEIVGGAAESYSVSDDGLIYPFKLREGSKWSDGENVTADDFVFALSRAVDPKNKAPYVSSLYGIVGAKSIATGKKHNGLGVTKISDNSLKIRLTSPDPKFLHTLTTAICMPCREDIYNKAKGQYGLVADRIVTNGSFKIRFWEKSDKFSLRINKFADYNGSFTAETSAVIFSAGETTGRAVRIDEGNLDMGFVNISETSDKSNIFPYETCCYSLIINKNSPLGSRDFRKAFAKSIHRNRLKNELQKSLNESGCLIPNTVLLNGSALSSKITITVPPSYEPNEAHSLYVAEAEDTKDMPSKIDILYYGKEEIANMALLVAENMQQALGAVVNAIPTDSEEGLFSAVKNGEYTLALVPISAVSSDPEQFFEQFTRSSNNNIFGFSDDVFDYEVAKIKANASEQTIIKASETALKELINDIQIIPIAMYSDAFSYGKDFTCPIFSPFGGVIDLALVKKVK
ncbi:MAG: peptide ABC transporter substrate-binding protein [Acutalibacteraceae bacterium]|nr:peptide ABC transporter substrate-binding protein [Acutalibacteraceae bacterium]